MHSMIVADDEPIERKVLIKHLKQIYKDELEIYEAENGREVLDIYHSHQPDILLLDIEMPGVTGLEAAEQIRRDGGRCSIIFLTAFDAFSYARRAISVHALDYLLKPCDEKELTLVIDSAIDIAENYPPAPARAKSETAGQDAASGESDEDQDASILYKNAMKYIDEHYMDMISVQDISEALCYSEAYFCKLFKQEFKQSFVTYLTIYRVEKAKKQLLLPSVNIKDIGKAVGYPDSNYFAKVFRRIVGKSPSDYRAEMLEK